MSLKDDMEDDLEDFFNTDEFAEQGSYTSKEVGQTVPVRLILDEGFNPGQDVGNTNTEQATVQLVKSELPATAKYGDLLMLDGIEWQVVKQLKSDDHVVTLELRRDARNRYKR